MCRGPNGPSAPGGQLFRWWFATQPGVTYRGESGAALPNQEWQTLTNVAGDGSLAMVVDDIEAGGSRFYRVRVP